jgi:hypothetical protein
LKVLLRRFGLRAISVQQIESDAKQEKTVGMKVTE